MVDWREAPELPIGGGIQHRNIPTATNFGVYFVSDGINWRYLVRFFAYPNIKNTFSSMRFVSFEWRGKFFGKTEEEQQQQPRNESRPKISTRLRFEAINFLFNLMNVFNLQSKLWQHFETAFRRARVLQSMKWWKEGDQLMFSFMENWFSEKWLMTIAVQTVRFDWFLGELLR